VNYYEHHLGDYAEATAHLSLVEHGAYGQLIRKYYATEKPLPRSLAANARLILAKTHSERKALARVLEEFFYVGDDDLYHNARCDEEIARFRGKSSTARDNANSRWHNKDKQVQSNGTAGAMRTHSNGISNGIADASGLHAIRNALQSPVSSHQSPITKHQRESSEAAVPQSPLPGGVLDLKNWKPEAAEEAVLRAERPDLDHPVELLKFRDHHLAKGSHKADWGAAFRLWIRSARQGQKGATKRAKTVAQLEAEEAERAQH
jgi:uncharacterized protein YdaU (DUF1376 family)